MRQLQTFLRAFWEMERELHCAASSLFGHTRPIRKLFHQRSQMPTYIDFPDALSSSRGGARLAVMSAFCGVRTSLAGQALPAHYNRCIENRIADIAAFDKSTEQLAA